MSRRLRVAWNVGAATLQVKLAMRWDLCRRALQYEGPPGSVIGSMLCKSSWHPGRQARVTGSLAG